MGAILDEALRLTDLGLALHWVWGPGQGPDYVRREKPGKAVALKGWQDLPALSAAALRRSYRRGYNLGLHTGLVDGAGVSLVALDIDGDAGFRFVAQRQIPLSPLRSETRKGQHWLYRHPGRGCRVATRCKVDAARCVDVRGERGNLVIPPSIHATGFVYRPIEPWTAWRLRAAPVWDPAWVPDPSPVSSSCAPLTRDAAALLRARSTLAKMAPAIQGRNGSRATFVAACTLIRRYGLDTETALDLLVQEYNPRCAPPWSLRELRHKVESAARSAGRAAP